MGKTSFKKLRGFTLLEVLIASAIFAGVLMMTTVTVSSGGSFYSKLKAQREASEDSRFISDLITRSVRDANLGFTISEAGGPLVYNFEKGIALLNCNSGVCVPVNRSGALGQVGNVLVSASNKSGAPNYIVFYSYDGAIYYNKMTIKPDVAAILAVGNPLYMISKPDNNVKIELMGYGPDFNVLTRSNEQAYVQFKIFAETQNYVNLDVRSRAKTEIISTVTSREME